MMLLTYEGFPKASTIVLASSSISSEVMLRLLHRRRPSLNPHSLAAKVDCHANTSTKPNNPHTCVIPHHPSITCQVDVATIGAICVKFPPALDWLLPLNPHHDISGWHLGVERQWKNSKAWLTITKASFGFLLLPLKTKLFLLFQTFHTAKGNTTFQGG